MKKRGVALLLAMVLSVCMLFAGCSKENPFVGTWKAKYDMTEEMVEAFEGYEDCFTTTLEIGFILEFTEDEVTFKVDEEAVDTFIAEFRTGVEAAFGKMLEEAAVEAGVTVEDFLAAVEMDRETYISTCMVEFDTETLKEEMMGDYGEPITAGYKFTDSTITLDHEEGIEIWNYELDGEKLTIDMGDDFVLEFER